MLYKFRFLLIPIVVVGFILLFFGLMVFREAEQRIAEEAEKLATEEGKRIETSVGETRELDAAERSGWRTLLSTRNALDIALHDGLIYTATDGGLLVHRPDGELVAHYTHLNGLPSNRIRCLISWKDNLLLGTDRGLAAVRGNSITAYLPQIDGGEKITALLPFGERVIVGTAGAGILSFDGSAFSIEHGLLPGADFKEVTALADWTGELVVGTRDGGVYIQRGASFLRLGPDEGLPHAYVTSLSAGEELLVGTVGGICAIDDSLTVRRWGGTFSAASLLRTEGSVLVGTLDGKLATYIAGKRRDVVSLGSKTDPVMINRLVSLDGRNWVLTSAGVLLRESEQTQPFGERPEGDLADNHISALTVDASGNLWIGYFDSGVDVFSSELKPLRRFTDPATRTVKCLYFDPQEQSVYLGSSKGLVRFRPEFSRDTWTTEDGLISNEVNCVTRSGPEEITVGTGAGISFISGGDIQSIYAFHGLINNKVFCLLPLAGSGEETRIVAGTLGGISILSGRNVTAQITPENSELPIHWITALADFEGSLLIGTYGGGLSLRNADGSWQEMPPMLKNLEINPNAILLEDDLLLAGTLDRGIALLRRAEAQWEPYSEGLSSLNVTAFAADERRIFIGSDSGIVVVEKGSF